MITLEQYFNGKPHTSAQAAAAAALLNKVNALLDWARLGGYTAPNDPDTGCQIGGDAKVGNGDGGFRGPDEGGSKYSSHKILWKLEKGEWVRCDVDDPDATDLTGAVDVFDPGDKLDRIIGDDDLERFGLYREHPDDTPGWCHLTTRAPGSGRRTFKP